MIRSALLASGILLSSSIAGYASDAPGSAGGLLSSAEELLPIVAVAGDAAAQADDRIRALNASMRANYARTLSRVSASIDPVLVVQFDGVGGTFNLRDGDRFVRVQPVPASYELAKSVAHVPLDLFVIIAPYLDAPAGGEWQAPLSASATRIRAALEHIEIVNLGDTAKADTKIVLTESLTFADGALARREFSQADYMTYSRRIFDAVGRLRAYAAEIQIGAVIAQLEAWRAEMGEERWRDLSAAVIAPYTLSQGDGVTQVLRRMMDPERVERRLIKVGGDYGNNLDVAISVFGRLYLDGLAARLVFAQDLPMGQEMTQSLSTSRDLMSVPAGEVVDRLLR